MEFNEAKAKFINTWGTLGSLWGINKAMAQIHALLFVSPTPLSMEDIMKELDISRGNASMNLRGLMDWGIVYKVGVAGERKEFFTSEKDVTELSRQIAKERSRRELQPTIRVLKEVSNITDDGSAKSKEFIKQTKAMHELASSADSMMNRIVNQEKNWITKTLFKLFK